MKKILKLGLCSVIALPSLAAGRQAINDLGQASGADPTSIENQVEHIKDSVQNEKFFPLETRSQISGFAVAIKSTVEIIKAVSQEYVAKVNSYYKYHGEEAPLEALSQAHRYGYAITNNGKISVLVNLSEWEFIHSPYTEILNRFQVRIPAGKTYRVTFLAERLPKHCSSPINIMSEATIFPNPKLVGAGYALLYCPEGYTPYLAIQNGLN